MNAVWNEASSILSLYDARLDQLRRIAREFPSEKLWERPRPDMVSLGNLICHVAGSMRDWFENGLAQGAWARDRALEFERNGDWDAERLIAHLDETRARCAVYLDRIGPEDWEQPRSFRDKTWTVREMLLRQLEHAAYHAGQAAFLRRLVADLDPAP